MNCSNTKMTLSDARFKLLRYGFTMIDKDENDSHDDLLANSVVGVLSSWWCDMGAKMDIVVVVYEVSNLNLGRIESDVAKLEGWPYPDFVGGRCPPPGVGRGRLTILTYLVGPGGSIDSDAMNRILQEPKKKWCAATFLAVQDAEGVSYYLENTTPFLGMVFYPEMRYWAGLMTGRSVPESPPKRPKLLFLFHLICAIEATFYFVVAPTRMLICFSVVALVGAVCTLIQRRRHICGSWKQQGYQFVHV